MLDHTGLGLVLRRTRHMEEDTRLTILFREIGKILVLSKGGLKSTNRLKSLQDPLTLSDYHIALAPQGIHARLIGAKLIASPHLLSQSWESFSLASKCCEVVDALLPFRAPSSDVFDILRSTLQRLTSERYPAQHWIQFNLQLLDALGYGELSTEVLRLMQPSESGLFKEGGTTSVDDGAWKEISSSSLNRCRSFLEARLNALLPWPLKSVTVEQETQV